MGTLPLPLAMIVSDAIWVDPGTGKKTILGTFSTIFGRAFPLQFPQLAVYVALTDGRGAVPLRIRLIDVDEERDPVREAIIEVEFPDPIAIIEGVSHFTDLTFPLPGEYRLQLFADREMLIERRILVIPVPAEEQS